MKKKINKCKTEGNRMLRRNGTTTAVTKKNIHLNATVLSCVKKNHHALFYLLQLIQFGESEEVKIKTKNKMLPKFEQATGRLCK